MVSNLYIIMLPFYIIKVLLNIYYNNLYSYFLIKNIIIYNKCLYIILENNK